jgi:hypothetical protein
VKDIIEKYEPIYQSLPKLPKIKKLWHHGYWDGPTSGVCEVEGQKCWFELVDEWHDKYDDYDDDDFQPLWWRRYLVHRLTDEQFNSLYNRHRKFQHMVGYHTDYDDDGHRLDRFPAGCSATQETTDQYFKETKTEDFPSIKPVSEEYIIGWYEW